MRFFLHTSSDLCYCCTAHRPAIESSDSLPFPTSAVYVPVGSEERVPGPNKSIIGVVRSVGELLTHMVPSTGRNTTVRTIQIEGPRRDGVAFGGMAVQMWASEAEAFAPALVDHVVAFSGLVFAEAGHNACTFTTEVIVEPLSAITAELRTWWGLDE